MRSVLLRNGLRLRNCFSSPPLLPFSSRNEKRYLSSSLFDDVFGKNHSSKMGKKNRFLSKSFAMWKEKEEEKLSHVPLVALIGRPNVGKSSLFNSFIREPRALISPVAGTTRDRAYGDLEWNGERMSLVDTGGMLGGNECELSVPIHNQTLVAIEEADILVFVVDVMDGLHHVDREIAKTLRKYKGEKKVIVAVNKVDNVHRVALAEEAIFERLGGYEVQQVSAIHRNGVSDLLDSLVLMVQKQKEEKKKENIEFEFESNVLPEEPPRSSLSDVQIKVGIFGKPNVGKSTLLNQLVGSSRVLVNDLAGTTRDPVNEELIWEEPFNTGKEYLLYRVPSSSSSSSLQKKSEEVRVEGEERSGVDGKDREDVALDIGETRKEEEKEDIGILEEDIGDAEKEEEEREREKIIEEVVEEGFRRFRFTLIDTAGVRRRSKHNRDLEHLSTMWALRAIEKCDVALLVLDSQDGGRSQDAHIAQSILEQYKSCIIVVNKWDVTGSEGLNIKNQKEYEAFLRKKFSFVDYVDVVFISALEGYNVSSLLSRCIQIFMKRQLRLSSRNLNEVIRRAQDAHQSPSKGKKSFKIRYGVQSRSSVPSFVFFVNRPLAVHYSYKRYLENTIRSYYGAFEGSPIRLFFRASREEREKKKGMERKGKKRGKRVLR